MRNILGGPQQLDTNSVIVTGGDPSLSHIMFGNNESADEFLLSLFLSVFSASFGLSNSLKNGVARPIGDGGCLDGLLSCRHLLAFFACGLSLVARGIFLGLATAPYGGGVSSH